MFGGVIQTLQEKMGTLLEQLNELIDVFNPEIDPVLAGIITDVKNHADGIVLDKYENLETLGVLFESIDWQIKNRPVWIVEYRDNPEFRKLIDNVLDYVDKLYGELDLIVKANAMNQDGGRRRTRGKRTRRSRVIRRRMFGGVIQTLQDKLRALSNDLKEIRATINIRGDENFDEIIDTITNYANNDNLGNINEVSDNLNELLLLIAEYLTYRREWILLNHNEPSIITDLKDKIKEILSELQANANAMNLEGGRRKTRGKQTRRSRVIRKRRVKISCVQNRRMSKMFGGAVQTLQEQMIKLRNKFYKIRDLLGDVDWLFEEMIVKVEGVFARGRELDDKQNVYKSLVRYTNHIITELDNPGSRWAKKYDTINNDEFTNAVDSTLNLLAGLLDELKPEANANANAMNLEGGGSRRKTRGKRIRRSRSTLRRRRQSKRRASTRK